MVEIAELILGVEIGREETIEVTDERNKQAQTNFELVKVNAGGIEVIPDGTVYQLNITVTESQVSTARLVAVLVHPDGSKELMSVE
uniref:Uncharacterized protein n=1 Tax=Solanum tuberosum TaxID=4113 RepID=M1C181_SOLTU